MPWASVTGSYGGAGESATRFRSPRRMRCALFLGCFVDVDLGVQMRRNGSDQLPQEGESSCGRLLGAVVAERIGLTLRFENEGSEPGREAIRQL